jgi:hypothetical protein
MVHLLTGAGILGLLLAPPLAAQTSRPRAVGRPAAQTAPKDILYKQDDTFIKRAADDGIAELELSHRLDEALSRQRRPTNHYVIPAQHRGDEGNFRA